jgi:lantibiotic leader peptide-processing serine protease
MKHVLMALCAALTAALVAGAFATAAEAAAKREFVVAYKAGALKAAKHAVRAHDGKIVRTNTAGRLMLVRAGKGFAAAVRSSKAIKMVVRNRRIGETGPKPKPVEKEGRKTADAAAAAPAPAAAPAAEPLAGWQWDMRMIGATPEGSYTSQPGNKGVTVAVIDTGIDGSHPDIAPNFDGARSRNWTVDHADIDGPCDEEIDGSCAADPANVDEDGHGTHVAGEIAAPINGFGMAGVAPNVTLVNDRAGQDSGFFFLFETINALDYAGSIGADVANMSFYTDPWQFNCDAAHPALTPAGQPADTPTEVAQQIQIRDLIQAAVNRAIANKVTLVAAAGNFHSNLDGTKTDDTSPDYPEGTEHVRVVSDWCRDMPNEATGVLSVSSVGPSTAKADYSNYGAGQETGGTGDDPAGEIDVAAPGGYFRDFFGTPQFMQPVNEILGPYPRNVAEANHEISGSGKPKSEFVVRDCTSPTNSNANPAPQPKPKAECAYYQLIQGTSMASPHAAGVAALIVSQFGAADPARPGQLTMDPAVVREKLRSTATNTPCPNPPTVSYVNVGRPASWTATCEGTAEYNGFYGDGIVSAVNAVK